MAGYPQGSGYPPYGAPNPYGAAPSPYGAPPAQSHGEKPQKDKYGQGAAVDPYAAQSHGYGAAPGPYGSPAAQPYGGEKPKKDKYDQGAADPYGAQSHGYGAAPYGEKPPKDKYGHGAAADPYAAQSHGYGAAPYGAPPAQPYGGKPPKDNYGAGAAGGYGAPPYGAPGGGYGDPFASLRPSAFPPGTDPNVVASFQAADRDGSGFIDDKELQTALSSYNQSFSLRTVHLLMYLFTGTNVRKIGPKEFASVFYSLQNWRGIFERFDRDRSGRIDTNELREALLSLGFAVSPVVLDLLVLKFDKSGGKMKSIEYDNFIECCLTVKGLTEKFKEKDLSFSGSATFTYEAFMLTVLPFLIA